MDDVRKNGPGESNESEMTMNETFPVLNWFFPFFDCKDTHTHLQKLLWQN